MFGKLTFVSIQQKGTQWGPPNNHPKHSPAARIEKKPTLAMSRQSIDPASFEDASDSDVSTYNPDPRNPGVDPKVYLTNPVQPPPANPETKEAIEARITELENIEKENAYRYELLSSKRQRKDDKTRQRRAIEDHRLQTARANKDERVRFRRAPQDNAFAQVDRAIDAEEFALRHKLKRLKKGRPLDEPEVLGRTYSSASMSPPVPSNYQSPIPPAKRHQPGPPGHMAPQRPPPNGQAPFPPYQFYQPSEPPRPGSRGYGPPPPMQSYPPYSPTNGPLATNEKPPSGTPQQSHLPAQNTTTTQLAQRSGPTHASPPHNADSSYNLVPPPPSSSSFAPINPPTSGFAAINPPVLSSSSTPVQVNVKPIPGSLKVSQPPMHGLDNAFHHSPTNPPGRVLTPSSTAAAGKRTPSTTHPYTQSEAFNNRHHKCERVDALNRGIWTSYGPGGTVENPTGPKVEMYLRCSHEACLRIDWRTVHGLQCHIVKNHEQPKGTIGSLEKALDRYGVPVSEIEEYERLHGPGSGGTMADPKNTKPKSRSTFRTSEILPSVVTLGSAQVQLPSESPTPPPFASAPNALLFPRLSQRTPSGGFIQNDIVYSDDEEEEKVGVKEGERSDEVKMQDAPTSISDDKPSLQEENAKTKELEPSVPTVLEVPAPSEQKTEEAGPTEDTEMTSPAVANKEAPTTSVFGEPVAAETSQNSSNPPPAPVQEPSRSTSPAQNIEKDKEAPPAYNQAQRELQGNNESGESDNEDSIVVKDRLRSPPKRTRAGRFVKKTSISKSPAYRYTRKGSDF
jgi:hypothetical protein